MQYSWIENSNNYTVRDDATDANNEYVAEAQVGITDETSKNWRIKKIVVSGAITKVLYPQDATGVPSNAFAFQWSLRATYTYS